mmetsp:Transcript_24000/g.61263  ORF Transcript_24000/g.61263 Transcript_24000/m.61263 type:complete len:265 (+) Transcript_24000:45-839(+)
MVAEALTRLVETFLTTLHDATDDELEQARALSSMVVVRVLILLSLSLNNLAWVETSATLASVARVLTPSPVDGSALATNGSTSQMTNKSSCEEPSSPSADAKAVYWTTFAVQAAVFLCGSYLIIWRFAQKAAVAEQVQASEMAKKKQLRFEQRFRSVAISNVLSSLAGVVVLSFKLALVASFPSAAAILACIFVAAGAGSATVIDCASEGACARTRAAQKRWTRIAGARAPPYILNLSSALHSLSQLVFSSSQSLSTQKLRVPH